MPTSHETPRLAQLALPADLSLVKLAVGRHMVATAPWVSGNHRSLVVSICLGWKESQGSAPY